MGAKKLKQPEADENGYPLSPTDINTTAWMYEDATGVTVVQESRDSDGKWLCTLQTVVPWGLLSDAVDRHRKAQT